MPLDKSGTYAFAAQQWIDPEPSDSESSIPDESSIIGGESSSSTNSGDDSSSSSNIKKEMTVYNITATGFAIPYVPFELNVTATTYNLITGAIISKGDIPEPTGKFGDGSDLDWEKLSSAASGNTEKSKVVVKSIDKNQTECKFEIVSKDNFPYSARVPYDVGWMRPIMPAQAKIGQAFQWKIAFKSLETIGTWDDYGASYKWQKQVVLDGDWEDCNIQVTNVRWSKGVLYGSGIIPANFNGKKLRLCVDYAALDTRYAVSEVENVLQGVVFKEFPDAMHIYGEAQTIKLFAEYTPTADDLDILDETYSLPGLTMKAQFDGVDIDLDDYLMDEQGDELDFTSGWTLADGGMEWEKQVYAKTNYPDTGTLTLITSYAKSPEQLDVDTTPVENKAVILVHTRLVGEMTVNGNCIANRDFNIGVSVVGEGDMAIPRYSCMTMLRAWFENADTDIGVSIDGEYEQFYPSDTDEPYLDLPVSSTAFDYSNVGAWEASFEANVSHPCSIMLELYDLQGAKGTGERGDDGVLATVEFEVQSIKSALGEAINERSVAVTGQPCCSENDSLHTLSRKARSVACSFIHSSVSVNERQTTYRTYDLSSRSLENEYNVISPDFDYNTDIYGETDLGYQTVYEAVCRVRYLMKDAGGDNKNAQRQEFRLEGTVYSSEKEAYRTDGVTNVDLMRRDALREAGDASWGAINVSSVIHSSITADVYYDSNWNVQQGARYAAIAEGGRVRFALPSLPYVGATVIYYTNVLDEYNNIVFDKHGTDIPDAGVWLRRSYNQPSTGDLEYSEWNIGGGLSLNWPETGQPGRGFRVDFDGHVILDFDFKHKA